MSTGTILKARDTTFAVGTSLASADTITGITNAPEAVVTAVGHGMVGANVVEIAGVVGMTELNGLKLPVQVLTADTFKLIKYSTLNSPTYVSGGTSAAVVFTSFCELTALTTTTGSTPETDDSTWCDETAKIGFGKPDAGSLTVNYNYAENTVVESLEASRMTAGLIVVRVGFKTLPYVRFEIGTVTQTTSGISDANSGKWEGTASIRRRFNPVNASTT